MRIVLLCLFLTFGPLVAAQDRPSPEKGTPVRIARFDSTPTIDGRLDDDVWGRATILKDFYQIQPGDNIAPSKPAQVLLGYDSQRIQPLHRPTRTRLPAQRPHILHQNVLPDPAQFLSQYRER